MSAGREMTGKRPISKPSNIQPRKAAKSAAMRAFDPLGRKLLAVIENPWRTGSRYLATV
jgi:hypothetical protein